MELALRKNPNQAESATKSDDPFEWDTSLEPITELFKDGWNFLQGKPSAIGSDDTGVRLDLYDPKYNTRHYIPKGFRVIEHESAADAIREGYESGENGVIVLEELNTVPRKDFDTIRYYFSIRRRGVDNIGPAIYGTSQRPCNLPPVFRTIGDNIFCGKLIDPDDIKAIKGPTGLEFVELLPTLTPDPDNECEFVLYKL